MSIDPKTREILDFIASRNVPPHYELSPEEGRAAMEKSREVFSGDPIELPRVEDLYADTPVGKIPLRLYAPSTEIGLPMVVFYHGGGWVLGSLDSHDHPCRMLAQRSGCMVIAVDYRLAPEHKFPAPVDDAWAALEWIAANGKTLGGNPERLGVCGDSAGGNLAAVAAQRAAAHGGPAIAHQILIYPVTDYDFTRPSMDAYGEGFLLTLQGMRWFWDHYLDKPENAENAEACPIKASSLSGLPPAMVITAEMDVLRDEGEAYARRLKTEGVPTRLVRYEGVIHGFFSMTISPRTREIIEEIAQEIRAVLGSTGLGHRTLSRSTPT